MKAGLIHYNLEVLGGAEVVALYTMSALHSMNHDVYLCATSYPERERTLARVGIDVTDWLKPEHYIYSNSNISNMPVFSIYQRTVSSHFAIKKLARKFNPDYFIVTQGIAFMPRDCIDRTIMYVHYPMDYELYHEKYEKGIWSLYAKPLRYIFRHLDYYKDYTLLANSMFTADVIKKQWDRDAEVIYPPCPQYDFPIKEAREANVCTLARFTPEKRYELILEVARSMPEVNFHLIGSVTPFMQYYLAKLRKIATPNVHFHVAIPFQQKLEVLQNCRVLLHTMYGEHFGIALVEAMSAGIIPVCHNSGGAKVDSIVPEQWRYEYEGPNEFTKKYKDTPVEDVSDVVSKVQAALDKWTPTYANELRNRAKQYSPDSFKQNLQQFVIRWLDGKN